MAHTKRIIPTTLLLLAISHLWASSATAQEKMVFIYHAPETPNDHRYEYHWDVLRAALKRTEKQPGDWELKASTVMGETRQIFELEQGTGNLTVMARDTTQDLEAKLLPVKIPVDKGLLGYRLMLIDKQNQPAFSQIKTLEQFQKIRIGQVSEWSDVTILREGGFTVVTNNSYENMFDMLLANRFDAFSRGVMEIIPEFETHRSTLPYLTIENELMLYYPNPVYFWFSKNTQGQQMAARVNEGMKQLLNDGTLDQLLHAHFDPLLKQLNIPSRRLFKIKNPLLPKNTPLDDKRLWYNPYQTDTALPSNS